ncbi:uncharacterized protein N7503_004821 [Penicillium pulvis]|uniref:uncharacterized protein n=1 Tax=Penicillium pulvis TaxID=1562058 RepID=UPI002548F873|nr:uncharacterized protein N7503_004821 [Penicillium pulvis]KAJ5802371.1 hypothetical protein N7503_004821 [Penicillium pulvis]
MFAVLSLTNEKGDKKRSYLKQLESFAKSAITAPTPPFSHCDESQHTGQTCDQSAGAEQSLVDHDTTKKGCFAESPSYQRHQSQNEAENEVDFSNYITGLTPLDSTANLPLSELQNDAVHWNDNFDVLPAFPALGYEPYTASVQPQNTLPDMSAFEARFSSDLEINEIDQASSNPSKSTTLLRSEDYIRQNFSLEDILAAGIRALSEEIRQPNIEAPSNTTYRMNREEGSEQTHRLFPETRSEQHLPDLHMNTIQLTTMSFVTACFVNAGMLGLSSEALCDFATQSPFYQTTNTGKFSHIKPLLQPYTTQLNIPHHPYLDVLPFPAFRNRVIRLLQMQPPPFDPAQLCNDLKNDGMICWGSTKRDKRDSVGSGVPWDIRSWERRDWFLKKWWILFDGPDGEMYQHSRWWCELRGESSSYPW